MEIGIQKVEFLSKTSTQKGLQVTDYGCEPFSFQVGYLCCLKLHVVDLKFAYLNGSVQRDES